MTVVLRQTQRTRISDRNLILRLIIILLVMGSSVSLAILQNTLLSLLVKDNALVFLTSGE